jgi:hypothetical protein
MANPERIRRAIAALAIMCAPACAHNNAPEGFLVKPDSAGSSLRGGWVELDFSEVGANKLSGELLAVSAESLWVQPSVGAGMVVPRAAIAPSSRLTKYKATTGAMAAGTVAGVISTISNGFVLIISAPIWIITGTAGAASDTRAAQANPQAGAGSDDALRAFSRYPLGMPRGADAAFTRWPPRRAR